MKVQKPNEKGQVLVIVTLLVVAFIAMLALVLDGGIAYTARRRAQNAADAGALAGADALCRTSNTTEAQNVALDYAVNRNQATTALALANTAANTVAVTTTVQVNNFFAWIFGNDQTTARATARAGCFPVCEANTVLPFAWACKPPAGLPGSTSCAVDYGTVDTPGPLYIVMDTDNVNQDFYCKDPDPTSPTYGLPSEALDCDIDNDGINEALAGGDRSWLNLNGGASGASEQENWITTGQSPLVQVESWVGGSTGVRSSVFDAVTTRVGDIVAIPVFNKFCDGSVNAACAGSDLNDPVVDAGNSLYFHVVALSPFKITGVCMGDNNPSCASSCTGDCSGHTAVRLANPPDNKWTNVKTIEGYFVQGYVPGMTRCTGTASYYAGAFTVHLMP